MQAEPGVEETIPRLVLGAAERYGDAVARLDARSHEGTGGARWLCTLGEFLGTRYMELLAGQDLPALEGRLEAAGAPWTTGRALPDWPPR